MPKTNENCEFCDVNLIHEDVVRSVHAGMIPPEQREALADFFKNMGDATRLGLLYALSLSEMCVCDLAALLGMSQSSVSHQLKTLRQARLVKSRRVGKVIYYTLSDEHPADIIRLGLVHLAEEG